MAANQDTVDGYIHVQTLEVLGKGNNGISLVRHPKRQALAICKTLHAVASKREALMMSALAPHPHIPKLYGYHNAEEEHLSLINCALTHNCEEVDCQKLCFDRIYMEHCDNGSLQDVFDAYHERGTPIPEAFLWEVLEDMLKTLCSTHLGLLNVELVNMLPDSKAPRRVNWIPIAHNDIHPGNIFLSSRVPGSSHAYPRILLGDWGLASPNPSRTTTRYDVRNLVTVIILLCFAKQGWPLCSNSVIEGNINDDDWMYSVELKEMILLARAEEENSKKDAELAWRLFKKVRQVKERMKERLPNEPLIL
jgi:serine/threonine protein kinase